jgi:hypothetical protein
VGQYLELEGLLDAGNECLTRSVDLLWLSKLNKVEILISFDRVPCRKEFCPNTIARIDLDD